MKTTMIKKITTSIIILLFFSKTYSQNIVRISENSDLTILTKVDSIKESEIGKIAYLTDLNSGQKRILKFKTFIDSFGYKIPQHQINPNDTILIFANIENDSLKNQLAINENSETIYKSLISLKEIKKTKNDKKKLKQLKKWFVISESEKSIKPYLSRIMRNDNDRNYFFGLFNVSENQLVFNKSQKQSLTKEISKSRCLKFEDFYIVYLMRYSYDLDFEKDLKNIMATYCLPFGDAQLHMMKTILYNKQNKELERVYEHYRKIYFGELDEAKKIYNEFIKKI